MQNTMTLPVRELVEFVLRGGSIDNRFGGVDRMAEGSRIHRKLQKAAGDGYQAEVPLSLESVWGDLRIKVEGRADGLYTDEEGLVVDEIKTTGAPLEMITEDFNRLHWAQAMCYAYILCTQRGLEAMRVRLTYYQVDTDEIKRFIRGFSAGELTEFYQDLLERYRRWGESRQSWTGIRDASIKATVFPFPQYRRGSAGWPKQFTAQHGTAEDCSVKPPPASAKPFPPCSRRSKPSGRGKQRRFFI